MVTELSLLSELACNLKRYDKSKICLNDKQTEYLSHLNFPITRITDS